MQRLDGVDHAEVNLVKGEGTVFPKAGKSFDPVLIPKAIKDAGFTAVEVALIADGTLKKGKESLELEVPGLGRSFLLADGSQAEALEKRGDLAGRRIRVTGKIHPRRADLPPGLTVESFQLTP